MSYFYEDKTIDRMSYSYGWAAACESALTCYSSVYLLKLPNAFVNVQKRICFLLGEQREMDFVIDIMPTFQFERVYSSPLKPGLHIVVIVVSTVANMFLTLFQAVLIHVNTSQA